jgi:hypothetical protein
MRTHPYRGDAEDRLLRPGDLPCADCGLPRRNTVHTLPETTQAARDRDAAIMGEKEEL